MATPEATPVTTPVVLTDATPGALLLHVPPDGVATRVVVEPMQRVLLPDMDAAVLIVTVRVAVQPPAV